MDLPDPRGHLQATGRDARSRKQYRYHSRWREIRDQDKYSRMIAFGQALPKVRKQIEVQLAEPGMGRNKVMATVVSLLDATQIRIGNSQYARDNRSYGLTTLRNKHVEVRGEAILFQFRGKSGVEHRVRVTDRRLTRVIKRCMALPGQGLASRRGRIGDVSPEPCLALGNSTRPDLSHFVNNFVLACAGTR